MVEVVSVFVAVIAAFASAFFSVRSLLSQTLENRIQQTSLRLQYFHEMQTWANETCDALSEAVHICEIEPSKCEPPSLFERRLHVRVRLSSLIDRGRLFFPNDKPTEFGQSKPTAFQGYRHKILDILNTAYCETTEINYLSAEHNPERRKNLVRAKRDFMSEVQEVLDPRGQEMCCCSS